MTTLTGHQIKATARKILHDHPTGIQWTKLLLQIQQTSPSTSINTIQGSVHSLIKNSKNIVKISRGFYTIDATQDTIGNEPSQTKNDKTQKTAKDTCNAIAEVAFYQPFGDWLRDELEEATGTMVLGGNVLKAKWGTPDVVGVLKPQTGDLVKFQPQIVSAEIKIDPNQTIVAFGQAVSYRLFSHKSYIVVPETTPKADLDRLEALSIITGIGLAIFTMNIETPNFRLVVRAALAQPDMFYVNEMASKLHDFDSKQFNALF